MDPARNKKPMSSPETCPEAVRMALAAVHASRGFKTSPRMRELLDYLVESRLSGQNRLKGLTVGADVFGLPVDAPNHNEGLVRRSMTRLRQLLAAYYADEGKDAPVRIELSRGCYLPQLHLATPSASMTEENTERPALLLLVEQPRRLTDDGELDWLATGLTEELVASLNGYADAFTAVHAPFADATPQDRPEATGARLTFRLRASLRRHGEDFRLGFQLLEGPAARVRWSEQFSLSLSDPAPFAVLEHISQRVAATLLDPHGIVYQCSQRHVAELPETYRALFLYNQYQERFTRERHRLARDALEMALVNEADHAETWAALADVYLGEALFGFNPTAPLPNLIERFLSTAQQAVALEPTNVMANYMLAMMLFYARRETEFRHVAERALRLAPNRPDNLAVIGMHRMLAGDWESGKALVSRAMALNPCHPSWHYLVFSLHALHHHRPEEALAVLSPFAAVEFFPFQINLAVIHAHLGKREEAKRCLASMYRLWPEAVGKIEEILDFWFPYGDLAKTFKKALRALASSFEEPEESGYGVNE